MMSISCHHSHMELDEEMLVTEASSTGIISASWALKQQAARKQHRLFLN